MHDLRLEIILVLAKNTKSKMINRVFDKTAIRSKKVPYSVLSNSEGSKISN